MTDAARTVLLAFAISSAVTLVAMCANVSSQQNEHARDQCEHAGGTWTWVRTPGRMVCIPPFHR